MERSWVLVTDGTKGQARSSLAAVRALARAGYSAAATTSRTLSLAAASRHCARQVPVPLAENPSYAGSVRSELARHQYLTVLPASDLALLSLGAPVLHLIDKTRLAQCAPAAGFYVPPTQTFASWSRLKEQADDIEYPVVIKSALAKFPAFRVDSRRQLPEEISSGALIAQAYVRDRMRAIAGVVWQGRLVSAVHQRYLRTWPVDCGTACAAQTIPPDEDLEVRLLELLKGYDGIFQIQLAGRYLLDVNPRVYGSLPLAVAANANPVGTYCDLLRGREVAFHRATPGVFYRWIEGDVRHLLHALRHKETTPLSAILALRPQPGAAHSTESLIDPGPVVTRLRYALKEANDSRR